MAAYTEMKDSGIDWIGAVPSHWAMYTLYQLVSQVKNKNRDLREKNLLSLSYGRIIRKNIDTTVGLLPESFEGYNVVEDGDIVLRLTDLQNDHTSLRVGLATECGIITSAYTTLHPSDSCVSKYLYYLLHTFDIRKGFYGMGSGVRQGLNYDEVKELRVILPSLKEQEAIAAYLDERCSLIDNAIAEAKAGIDEYKTWKASVIFQAVTEGIDTSIEFCESGIGWIDKIPAHWKVCRIKDCAAFAPACNTNHLKKESIVTFSPMECIKNGFYIPRDAVFGDIASSYTMFQEGDIVFAKVTPCFENGNIAIMEGLNNGFGYGSSELFVLRANTVERRFLFYFLQNEKFKQMGCSTMTGTGGLKRVSGNFVKNCYILLPPVEEQIQIADYLDRMCETMQTIVEEKQALVNRLESYKRSLIFEVVTGKRKVVQ